MGWRELLFPPKCVLCQRVLAKEETDLCHDCRRGAPEALRCERRISFVAKWTSVWYYRDAVRSSLLRFKFGGRRYYGDVYGRLLAMKLMQARLDDFDVLTWVPADRRKKWKRGYDHVGLIAASVARELGTEAVPCLKKVRHTATQSAIRGDGERRANVLGAYRVTAPEAIANRRVLLIDDIITTGATASECAKTLLIAGAQEVTCASVAAAQDKK